MLESPLIHENNFYPNKVTSRCVFCTSTFPPGACYLLAFSLKDSENTCIPASNFNPTPPHI